MSFIRIPYQTMVETFFSVLVKNDFFETRATTLAEVFATNSLEGVYTHGVNRFSRFIQYAQEGYIKKDGDITRQGGFGGLEQWNGNLGPGITNAIAATTQACSLADKNGLGCVALSHTNHWMRGGYYGWQAARAGYVFIGWTNTQANMPAWGAVDSKLGNNPLVIAVPYQEDAIVLDTALSQYSYGSLDLYRLKDELLPVPGGYDTSGQLTQRADEIIQSRRVLPIGYWKGAGMSLLLDILATILSGGLSTSEISKQPVESALSQIFIAIDIRKLGNYTLIENALQQIIADYHASEGIEGKKVRYPGERIGQTREENLSNGIPVAQDVWKGILRLS
jgi:3-dehydro-L-gulonate 2-dehydrogenase